MPNAKRPKPLRPTGKGVYAVRDGQGKIRSPLNAESTTFGKLVTKTKPNTRSG